MFSVEYLEYQTGNDAAPLLFSEAGLGSTIYWIAQGTDGDLYLVPDQPGGWLQRSGYDGGMDGLVPVAPEEASTIAWFLYGDVGRVSIARTKRVAFEGSAEGERGQSRLRSLSLNFG
jgi:hypothetical protein